MREFCLGYVLCVLTASGGCTHPRPGIPADERTFLTGSEQSVIESFVPKRDSPPATRPAQSLDLALGVLLSRAYPPPDRLALISGATAALCDDYRGQTRRDVPPAQREAWLQTVASTNSFAPVLEEISQHQSEIVDRKRLVRAGLRGMLRATGWDAACVLTDSQVAEFKQLEEARGSPAHERGVLGLNLDRWPVVQVVPGSPAADAGLRNGDVLTEIAGQGVSRTTPVQDVMKRLAGPPGDSIRLTVLRDGQQFSTQVYRLSLAAMRVKADQVAPGVVRIAIPLFEGPGIADRVKRIIQESVAGGAHAVILDLRGNPGGRPEEANAVADIFLDSKRLQIFQFSSGLRVVFRTHPGALNIPVVVLTDHNTGSGAEMLSMALRDNGRAKIVGQRTAGALFGKDTEDVGDNQIILFRCQPTVLSPTGKDYSITGIPPDVSAAGPQRAGRDEALRLALESVQVVGPAGSP